MSASDRTHTHAAPRAATSVRAAFAVLVLTMLPAVLDQTILGTALPTIAADLGSLDSIPHLVTVYVLTSTVSLPLWGKLGDRGNRRGLLAIALAIFLAASAVCGAAGSFTALTVARAVQGVGAGGLMSLAMTMVSDLVEPRERARWQGRVAAVFAAATVVGPLLGGVLVDAVSWRLVFYVNLPLGLVALVGVRRLLPAGTAGRDPQPLDLPGFALLGVGASAALLAITAAGGDLDLSAVAIVVLAVAALVVTGSFAARERRAADPLLPLSMLATPTVRVASAGLFLATAALFSVVVFVPVLLQAGHGLSPTAAGLVLATMTAGLTAATTLAGRRIARTGRLRRLPPLGAALMSAGLVVLSLDAPRAHVGVVIAALVVFGAGFGLTTQLLMVAIQNSVERTRIGVATSAAGFFRAFGGAAGAAALGAVFAAGRSGVGDAVAEVMLVAAGLAAVAAIVLLALPGSVDRALER